MKLMKMNRSLIGILVAGAAVSCSDELVNNDVERPTRGEYSDAVSFVVTDNTSATRGGSAESRRCGGVYLHNDTRTDSLYMQMEVSDIDTPLSTRGKELTEGELGDIRMTCRMRTKDSNYNHYFADLPFSRTSDQTSEGTDIWKSTPEYYWLDANTHFNFYGYSYAPVAAANTSDYLTYKANPNGYQNGDFKVGKYIPILEYTVPGDAREQIDLVYHNYESNTHIEGEDQTVSDIEFIANYSKVVKLNMKHALAKVAFKTGVGMADGTIKSVTIKNVYDKGTLDLSTGKWDIDKTSTKDFSIEKEVSDCDKEINSNDDGTYFFLLPESAKDDTFVEIIFNDGNKDIKYTAPLAYTWEAGKSYVYTITIDPELEIDLVPETQDAHYVIAKAHIKASGMPGMREGQQWELSVQIDGNHTEKASAVLESKLNDYAKNGYWTDRKITRVYDKNGEEKIEEYKNEEARGSEILHGTGDQYVYIFIPENATELDRRIILTLGIKGSPKKTYETYFIQKCPDWTNNGFGWEEEEEYTEWLIKENNLEKKEGHPEAPWGFNWSRNVTYKTTNNLLNRYVYWIVLNNMINTYSANEYATISPTSKERDELEWYQTINEITVNINYNKIGQFEFNEFNDLKGLENCLYLINKSGSTTTNPMALENAIKEIKYWALFFSGYKMVLKEEIDGSSINNELLALGYALKKNKYNINEIISVDDSNNKITDENVTLNELKWYLPAKGQFSYEPKNNPLSGTYWTSNPDEQDNVNAHYYNKSVGSDPRNIKHKIRACRNRP